MGQHRAEKGQPGSLPGGTPLIGSGRGAHRAKSTEDTDPELEPVTDQDTDDNAEGWRN